MKGTAEGGLLAEHQRAAVRQEVFLGKALVIEVTAFCQNQKAE
jgi:hypothetical protein